eukprot:488471_1
MKCVHICIIIYIHMDILLFRSKSDFCMQIAACTELFIRRRRIIASFGHIYLDIFIMVYLIISILFFIYYRIIASYKKLNECSPPRSEPTNITFQSCNSNSAQASNKKISKPKVLPSKIANYYSHLLNEMLANNDYKSSNGYKSLRKWFTEILAFPQSCLLWFITNGFCNLTDFDQNITDEQLINFIQLPYRKIILMETQILMQNKWNLSKVITKHKLYFPIKLRVQIHDLANCIYRKREFNITELCSDCINTHILFLHLPKNNLTLNWLECEIFSKKHGIPHSCFYPRFTWYQCRDDDDLFSMIIENCGIMLRTDEYLELTVEFPCFGNLIYGAIYSPPSFVRISSSNRLFSYEKIHSKCAPSIFCGLNMGTEILNCQAAHRISVILVKYRFRPIQSMYYYINKTLGPHYSDKHLLNDYSHIKKDHRVLRYFKCIFQKYEIAMKGKNIEKYDNCLVSLVSQHNITQEIKILKHLDTISCHLLPMGRDERINDLLEEPVLITTNFTHQAIEQKNTQCATTSNTHQVMRVLNRFTATMKKTTIYNIDTQVKILLDDFLSLLQYDHVFQLIYDQLRDGCNTEDCAMFQRYCSNQLKENVEMNTIPNTSNVQILDKIHCYFRHSFDIGHRLDRKDTTTMHRINSLFCEQQLFDSSCKIMNEILSLRRDEYIGNVKITQRIQQKYNQLNLQKMYKFGQQFKYGYENEDLHEIISDNKEQWNDKNVIYIKSKYASLKDELTHNNISRITIQQFNNEYQKSNMHHTSSHRKQKYTEMKQDHILSLMIYCNYNQLEHELSKTYYLKNMISHHEEFALLAKNIKYTVHTFGTEVRCSGIQSFYHGINEKLQFPYIVSHGIAIHTYGINIWSPLSTSSSIEVAINFATIEGLIIDFGVEGHHSQCKHFPLAWISDYPSEQESLFIQNCCSLQINNIIEVKTGIEYVNILRALQIINKMMNREKLLNRNSITKSEYLLIKQLISHQLYHSFKSLSKYAESLINTYCKNTCSIEIDYDHNNYYLGLIDLFFHSKLNGIKMNLINALFPNISLITIVHVCKSS